MESETKVLYYGDQEIVSVSAVKENGLFDVTLKNGTVKELSTRIISETVGEKPIDATTLREKRCFPVVADVLKLLLEVNAEVGDIDFITQRVIMSINESLKKSNEMLWGKPTGDQTMSDVHQVLMRTQGKSAPAIESPYQATE